ncbi:MAG TPA: transcription termination/antitermination protein NusG [Actinomycetota bacterium]|nr:transcription termination/antitermination protein NusG [Actinomycetota bacterium]
MDESTDRTPGADERPAADDALAAETATDEAAGDAVLDAPDVEEQVDEAAPIVGSSADLGEPYVPVGDTFQASTSVPADEEPPERGVAILQEADEEESLPSTIDAIGTGPTHLVSVPVDEQEPVPGMPVGDDSSDDMDAVGTPPADTDDATDDGGVSADAVETIEAVEALEAESLEGDATEAADELRASEAVPTPEVEATTDSIEAERAVEAMDDTPADVDAVAPEAQPVEAETPDAGAPVADTEDVAAAPPAATATKRRKKKDATTTETADGDEDATPRSRDPFRGPGDWYVVHTYAGYENKVKTNLQSRIHTMQMEDKIFDVHIPMEDVMEIKGGKKQVVQRKVFPGYLLVKMEYDNDSWYVVRNTPGVTGFVASGTGSKPTPLSRREVEKILAVKKEEAKPQFRLGFEENDVVRIISGPFADFNGTISEINLDQSKLKVLVNIFDRETPVELSFDQVAKV